MNNYLKILEECDENSARLVVNILEELSEEQKLHSSLKEALPLIVQFLTKITTLFPLERNHVEQLIAKL